ncbi:MAG: DUF5104 domain-containing protein [Firmicutes bacterium]|nr:DUF5104 domain-containing protein [Bacillota bacterium]
MGCLSIFMLIGTVITGSLWILGEIFAIYISLLIPSVILIIIGIANIRKSRYKGKFTPALCIISGFIMSVTFSVAAILASFNFVTDLTSPPEYDLSDLPSHWQKDGIGAENAENEAIETLLASADSGDRQTFINCFSRELHSDADFNDNIDKFLSSFPKGLSECVLDGGIGSTSGFDPVEVSAYYECNLNGQWYHIDLCLCSKNSNAPDEVGVTYFTIMNTEGRAVYNCARDQYSTYSYYNGSEYQDSAYYDSKYLLCDIKSSCEVKARLIEGDAFLWTSTPSKKLTAYEMKTLLSSGSRLDDNNIMNIIGKANASVKYDNHTSYTYYYELLPENGEPRYACIVTFPSYGEISSAYVCTSNKALLNRSLK